MEIVKVFSCDECGFDNTTLDNPALVESIASQARKYRAPLTRGLPNEDLDALLRARPAPDVWSALEYAAHQRDVIRWYGARIDRVLAEDRPQLAGHDFTAAPDTDVAAAALADEIGGAATSVATTLSHLTEDQWARIGIGSSDGGERDIRNLASRVAHEGVHHLLDIGRSLRAARS